MVRRIMWRNNIYDQSINESDIKLSSLSDLVRGETMQPCVDAGAETQTVFMFLCYVIELIKMPQYYNTKYYNTKYYNTKARGKYLYYLSLFFPPVQQCLHIALCLITISACSSVR